MAIVRTIGLSHCGVGLLGLLFQERCVKMKYKSLVGCFFFILLFNTEKVKSQTFSKGSYINHINLPFWTVYYLMPVMF